MDDNLPNVHLFTVQMVDDYFTYISQFLRTRVAPLELIVTQEKQIAMKVIYYQIIVGSLYKLGVDGIL